MTYNSKVILIGYILIECSTIIPIECDPINTLVCVLLISGK